MRRFLVAIFPIFLFLNSIFSQTPVEGVQAIEDFSVSGNSNVTMDFQTAIVTYKGAIYYTYVDAALNACISKKDVNGNITNVIITSGVVDDAHKSGSIGIDAEGYIHWAGNMHNDTMKYFRSAKPEDITLFNALNGDTINGGMFGSNGVSYGRFIQSRKGTLMYISRQRVGSVNDGWVAGIQCGHIQVYNTDTRRWIQLGSLNYQFMSDRGVSISGGMDAIHQVKAVFWDSSGAGALPYNGYQGYKIRVVFDKNNRMHMAWTVAKNPVYSQSNNDVANAHTHLMYAYSDDEGITWKKSDASSLALPITTNNGEILYIEDPAINSIRMFNGAFVSFTSDNKPVVMAWSGSLAKMVVFRNTAPGIWMDVSNAWANGWPGESFIDDNGWTTILNMNRWRRSNDNGNTFQQYERDNSYRGDAGQSVDYQYLYETGKVRFMTVKPGTQSVRTIFFQNSGDGQVKMPVISPISGTTFFGNSQQITITCETPGAIIRYTTDGSTPSVSNGNVYSGPFNINSTTTIKAVAFSTSRVDSRLAASRIIKTVQDLQPPTKPANVVASYISPVKFRVDWDESTDNVGVARYVIYRNSDSIGFASTTRFEVSGLAPATQYSITIKAFDAQQNASASSDNLLVTTSTFDASILFCNTPPLLDGIKEQNWSSPVFHFPTINAGTVRSYKDLSATWTSAYDNSNIYFYVDVTDDSLFNNNVNWFENDGIEIYIDATYRRGSSYANTDFHFNYMFGDTILHERSRNISTTGSQVIKLNKSNGYIIELKIPWVLLGINPPDQGYRIGLDLMVIDNDSGMWQGKVSWFNTADNSWNNPSTFGLARISGLTPVTNLISDTLQLKALPNPSNGNISLVLSKMPVTPAGVRIVSTNGIVVYVRKLQHLSTHIDLGFLPKGLYFIEYTLNYKTGALPILIQ